MFHSYLMIQYNNQQIDNTESIDIITVTSFDSISILDYISAVELANNVPAECRFDISKIMKLSCGGYYRHKILGTGINFIISKSKFDQVVTQNIINI